MTLRATLAQPSKLPRIALLFWAMTLISITVWAWVPGYVVGWDLNVYRAALHSLRMGHDPYLDGMAVQRIYHAHLAEHWKDPPPYTYVYSPITLPFLRVLLRAPAWLLGCAYWVAYVAAAAAVIWVSSRFAEPQERTLVALLAPAAIFFPGLLQQDVLFSGNVAYLIYGAAFSAAYLGWRRGLWWPFYTVVVLASCFKAPLLSLLAIPVLSARRQWISALATAVCGVALFAVQPRIWPALFQHYLEAVELQFSYNHDFSSSPAGLVANAFYAVIPYQVTSLMAYLLYAGLISATMLYLARAFFGGRLSLEQWGPVMLIGVILLNPRIMEYDVAPLSLCMALVLWRAAGGTQALRRTAVRAGLVFAVANLVAIPHRCWRWTECLLLLGLFSAGSLQLLRHLRQTQPESPIGSEELSPYALRPIS